jgi:glycosyltransferase involved in cell wall biosynthesis
MSSTRTRVAILGLQLESPRTLGRFEVHGVPLPSIGGLRQSFRAFLRDGMSGASYQRAAQKAEHVDDLYRNRDPLYMDAAEKLIEGLRAYDILIFSTYNPLHPEMLADRLHDKIKVLGFTDDPHSTYVRGIPYLWAFDAAYYISPGYSPSMGFAELFNRVGFRRVRWLPLAQPIAYPQLSIDEIRNRSINIAYVGCPTGSKVDRLLALDRAFGREFALYGRWRLGGYYGYVRPLIGEQPFFRRVRPISPEGKAALYRNTMIGFNMHVSDRPSECGNMRTYETAAFGMMPLCDRAGLNLQRQIFDEGTEAIYYNNIEEAVELARHYVSHPEERARIAFAAHRRTCAEYSWDKVTHDFLEWLVNTGD